MNQRREVAVEFPAVTQIQHNHPEGYGAVDQPHAQGGKDKGVAPQKSVPPAFSLRVAQVGGCGGIAIQSAVFIVDIFGMIE
jgi:hypothetical protein